jgi:glycosyltransferase involved in cell wall biosynthesis
MRIALVIRNFSPAWDQASRYVLNAGQQLIREGHRIHLVTDTDVGSEAIQAAMRCGLDVVPVHPAPARHDYMAPAHAYADRVYATLRSLRTESGIDAVEFTDQDGEGLTTIRAKRLLGEFCDTALVVRLHAPATLVAQRIGDRRTDFRRSIAAYAEDYCIRHADLLLLPSQSVAHYAQERSQRLWHSPYPLSDHDLGSLVPLSERPEDHIVFAGTLDPAGGVDLFLAAADRLAQTMPKLVFTLFGPRNDHRRFGLPYTQELDRLITGPLRDKLRVLDPVAVTDRTEIWRSARVCVFPARWDNCAYEALEAMSHGGIVICAHQGGMPQVVTHAESGFLVDPTDCDELTGTIARLVGTEGERIWRRAAAAARAYGDPHTATARILAGYRQARRHRKPQAPGTSPTVSVIIAVFNKGLLLRDAVASVRKSEYPNVEIIVVNDGSTDTCTNAVFDALTGVTKIAKRNGGPGSAYNAGFAASTGDFVLPLDGDDLLHPEFLPTAVRALQRETQLAYVTCYVQHFDLLDVIEAPVGLVPDLMTFLNTAGKRTGLFRRTVFEALRGFDEQLPTLDDWELLIRMSKNGYDADVIPRALFHYRRHAASLTFTSPTDLFLDEHHYILTKHADLLAKQAPAPVYHLLHLWKNKIELSRSARWRDTRGTCRCPK